MGVCAMQTRTLGIQNEHDYQQLDYNRYSTYQKLETIATGIVQEQHLSQYYSALIQRIIASKQDHILRVLSELPPDRKQRAIQALEYLDIETIDSLYYHCYLKQQNDQFKGRIIQGTKDYDKGLKLISEQKVGIILLAGGKCCRLQNKILENIGLPSRKCILQIMFEKIRKILNMAQVEFDTKPLSNYPIGILVSENNRYFIQQMLKQKKDFGFDKIHYFLQNQLPVLNIDGKIQFEDNLPQMTSDGTGNIYPQLTQFMKEYPNMKYIHLLGCDNLMALPLDPDVLGMEADVICKTVETQLYTDDRLFYQNDYFKSVECQDQSMTENPDNFKMCLNDLYVNVQFLQNLKNNHEKSLKLAQRYHAIKRGQTLQFEKHIQDIIEAADTTILHQVDEAALMIYDFQKPLIQLSNLNKKWLGIKGSRDEDLVEISAYMSYAGEELKQNKNADIKYPLLI